MTPVVWSTSRVARSPTCSPACPKCRARLDRAAIDRLTDPRNYLGVAPQMIDGMLHGRELT